MRARASPNALTGQRVGAQVGEAAVVIEARGLLQVFEHARHATGLEACLGQHRETHAVGLALHVARKIQLSLDGGGLPTINQRLCGRRVAAGRQDAQHHRGHAHPRVARLLPHHAGNVPLGHVRQLVRQHRGQLVGCRGHRHQTQVDADVAPRQRKRVHRLVSHQERLPGVTVLQIRADLSPLPGRAQQVAPQRLHVLQQQGIVDHGWVAADGTHDAVTQSTLGPS